MADRTSIEWTDVPGYPGYAVTIHGDIHGPRGLLRPMRSASGHLYVITGPRRARTKLWVHHAVLFTYVSARPEGQECRHLDGNPENNALVNLCWGTKLQNALDAKRHGRRPTGEAASGARLTAVQAAEIRRDPRSARAAGAEYGVSHTTVLAIRRGERWVA